MVFLLLCRRLTFKNNKRFRILVFCATSTIVITPPMFHFTNHSDVFKEEILGILVAEFEDINHEHNSNAKSLQGTIVSTLNVRFQELRIPDVKAKETNNLFFPYLRTHKEAREIGEKYNADIVMWGQINMVGIHPRITIVEPHSRMSLLIQPEIAILKNSLSHELFCNNTNQKDIRSHALTDELVLIASFVTGLKFYQQSDYKKALNHFTPSFTKNLNKISLDTSHIFFYIGDIHLRTNNYNMAINNFSKYLEIYHDNFKAYYNRGRAYYYINKYDKAISDYDQVLNLKPRHTDAYINRGISYHAVNKYDLAISDFDKVLGLHHEHAEAYNNRGNAYSRKGEYKKAISDFNQAIKINPKFAVAFNNRGTTYVSNGEHSKALLDYNKAIELDPNYYIAFFNRGIAYKIEKEYKKALTDFNKVIEFNPKLARAYYYKAFVCEKAGCIKESIKAYNEFIQHASSEYDVHVDYIKKKIKELKERL